MSLPSSQILPPVYFRHIGYVMAFMVFIACYATIGFISVKDLTTGWTMDIKNTLSIEVPPYEEDSKTVLSDADMQGIRDDLQKAINNDPIIASVTNAPPPRIADNDFDIALPIFMTIILREDRAENAEQRLIDTIKKTVPLADINTPDQWQQDIQQTAMTLKLILALVMVTVVTITAILCIATIRMQIQANEKTIELIHLLGGEPRVIASLFQSSITRSTLWGGIIGLLFAMAGIYPILSLMQLETSFADILLSMTGIFIGFVIMTRCVTYLTVMKALRSYP